MVKKVKRFLVFILFSFFYSLLFGKVAEAAKVTLVPKTSDGSFKYNGITKDDIQANTVAEAISGKTNGGEVNEPGEDLGY